MSDVLTLYKPKKICYVGSGFFDITLARKGDCTMRKYITLKELKEMYACDEGERWFQKHFDKRALIGDLVKALHKARKGDWEAWILARNCNLTKALLACGANIHANKDVALCYAIDDADLVLLLCEKGINVKSSQVSVANAIHYGNIEVIETLLRHKAPVDEYTLRRVLLSNNKDILNLFLKYNFDFSAVSWYVVNNINSLSCDILGSLLNCQTFDSNTLSSALKNAVNRGNVKTTQLLYEHGARIL